MADRKSSFRHHENDSQADFFPPYSRLFIVCNKSHSEQDFKDHFSKYGTIEDVRVVRDRGSGENKGVAYIQFAKTSEAATALEEMHGKVIGNIPRPIKVMVASSKNEGPTRDNDEDKYKRLFTMVPKSITENELNAEFGKFGQIDLISIVRDKSTLESKGYAYIRFKKFSGAANAFENVDKRYRAIFAEPKRSRRSSESNFDMINNRYSMGGSTPNISTAVSQLINTHSDGYSQLNVICHPHLSQDQVWKLFDLIPGMDYCQYKIDSRNHCGLALVSYASPVAAAYARDKLHGFEYPPGHKLIVKPDRNYNSNSATTGSHTNEILTAVNQLKAAMNPGSVLGPNLAQLAETIAQASSLITAAASGANVGQVGSSVADSVCSVKLPPVQPLADVDSVVAQRCFLVCQPQPPPLHILRDAFCRFGNMINIFILPNKNVGYVLYASADSAQQAMKILHGAEICGIRIKVIEAEDRPDYKGSGGNEIMDIDDRRKRAKIEN